MELANFIKIISDDELFQALKRNGIHVGPVVKSTRSLYERRLLNHLIISNTGKRTIIIK